MEKIKKILKKILPKKLFDRLLVLYHAALAYAAAIWYCHPADKMIVIGVTGTKGKTTTTQMIAAVLEASGEKVGYTTTAGFQVANKKWLNDKKMTMLGRFALQKLLREMVLVGCKYAVIETSSEGIKQKRHKGINYDYLVFTNLTPEHIESHGSFSNYKEAKLAIFKELAKGKKKTIGGEVIEKIIVANGGSEFAPEFLRPRTDKKFVFKVISDGQENGARDLRSAEKLNGNSEDKDEARMDAKKIKEYRAEKTGFNLRETWFTCHGQEYHLKLAGLFNIANALPAIIIGEIEQIPEDAIKKALAGIQQVPGRMEFINGGQNFDILVDYAHEPASMEQLFFTLQSLKGQHQIRKIIHVFGSAGGGRDRQKRQVLGQLSGENADISIVTNEDPYDDDPMEIIKEVAAGAEKAGKTRNVNLYAIPDRKEAIRKGIAWAEKGDMLVLTGKGAEQFICLANGKKMPWDDRAVVRELLHYNPNTTN